MLEKNSLTFLKRLFAILCFFSGIAFFTSTKAQMLRHAYIDKAHNVHIVTTTGHQTQLTRTKNAASLTVTPDRKTAAWLIMNDWTAEGDDGPQSEKLAVYRNGKITIIECGMFIRGYWFWQRGRNIAIDCGGRHFAGYEILYDAGTSKEIARFVQGEVPLEKRPAWSLGDN